MFAFQSYNDIMSNLEEEIYAVVKEGTILCSEALAIAATLGISPKEVGDKLNEMKIKIISCQLGCFE